MSHPTREITLANKNKVANKGVPYKGFFETLKIYRKLHFKRSKEIGLECSNPISFLYFLLLSLIINFFSVVTK